MEKWASVKGFEGRYEVSDQGKVRSVAREVPIYTGFGGPTKRRVRSKLLTQYATLLTSTGRKRKRNVQQLVKEAFKPPYESV